MSEADVEVQAIVQVLAALEPLSLTQQDRVMDYVTRRTGRDEYEALLRKQKERCAICGWQGKQVIA